MLFVLIATFRIIAYLILWVKGRRTPFSLPKFCKKKPKQNAMIEF